MTPGEMALGTLTLGELARRIGAQLTGDASVVVDGCSTLEDAGPTKVAFLANPKYRDQVASTKAAAVIVVPSMNCEGVRLLKMKDPYLGFAKAVVELHGYRKHPHTGIHPQACVDPTASIGDGTVVYPGVYVGARTRIGRDCILYPNAVVYEDCVLGDRVIVHAHATIGVDGFGFATSAGIHHKIPQVGTVIIENDVEIGASAVVERGAISNTVVGTGTKIAGLVVVGHGVRLGEHGLLVSLAGIAGSTTVGHHLVLGAQAGIVGHLNIGNRVTIAARSGVMSDIEDGQVVMGAPAMALPEGRRNFFLVTHLSKMLERIRALEQQVAELSTDSSTLPEAGGGEEASKPKLDE
jgi:UDP-3-O-[3-hydroxymyristoyl] glucosamine N-acyltransferase